MKKANTKTGSVVDPAAPIFQTTGDAQDAETTRMQAVRSSRIAGRSSKSRAGRGFQKMWFDLRRLEQQVAELQAVSNTKRRVYHEPQSLAELRPRREPEPGKTAMEMIAGQWPGDEEPEDLLRQLKDLG
jgi:hypothetical protein